MGLYENKIVAVNDSGNDACIFLINDEGEIKDVLRHVDLNNRDWEAVAKDDQGNFYIADIGNNNNRRDDLGIYKISISPVFRISKINFRYKEQVSFPPEERNLNFDAEALAWINDSLCLFTKNKTTPYSGYTKMYRIPAVEGNYVVVASDSICLGTGGMYLHSVTGACYNSTYRQLAILTYSHVYIFNNFNGQNLSSSYYGEFVFDSFSQKESIVFDEDNNLVIADEKSARIVGGKMYWYNIREMIDGTIPYTTNTIEKIYLRHKGKGKAVLNYFVNEHGEYELVFFDLQENMVQHHFLPIGNKLRESRQFEFNINYKAASKWIARVYRNKRMIYSNRFNKMFYD